MQISTAPKSPMKPVFHSILDSATITNKNNADQRVEKYSVCVIFTQFSDMKCTACMPYRRDILDLPSHVYNPPYSNPTQDSNLVPCYRIYCILVDTLRRKIQHHKLKI